MWDSILSTAALLLIAGCGMIEEANDPFAATGIGDEGVIAFTSMRDGNYEIYLMDATGDNLLKLTDHPALDTSPAWSPDGTKIAFVSDRNGHKNIFVMRADGSNPSSLTQSRRDDIFPAWMPGDTFSTKDRCLLCPGRGGPRF